MENSTAPADLVTVRALAAEFRGALSEPAIRDHVWRAEPRSLRDGRRLPPNGLAPAIIRIGAKVLIDRRAYRAWIESHRLAPLVDGDDSPMAGRQSTPADHAS